MIISEQIYVRKSRSLIIFIHLYRIWIEIPILMTNVSLIKLTFKNNVVISTCNRKSGRKIRTV